MIGVYFQQFLRRLFGLGEQQGQTMPVQVAREIGVQVKAQPYNYPQKPVEQVKSGSLSTAQIYTMAKRICGQFYPDVDPLMITVMCWIESSNNPRAKRIEPDGRTSYGLTQVLWPTAQEVMRSGMVAVKIQTGTDLYIPENAIHFCAAYIRTVKQTRQRYGWPVTEQHIVRGYNGGPGYDRIKTASTQRKVLSMTQTHWNKYASRKPQTAKLIEV